MSSAKRLIVGMSGASGAVYGIRLLEELAGMDGIETHLVMSDAAKINIAAETDRSVAEIRALADHVHANRDVAAPIASGTFAAAGMAVAPCSIRALSGIAHSHASTLLERAADVALKERRRLVLVPRETPLHAGHCELLARAARIGAVIAPPMPAHYIRPRSVEELVDHHVGRVLELFGIESDLVRRWRGLGDAGPG